MSPRTQVYVETVWLVKRFGSKMFNQIGAEKGREIFEIDKREFNPNILALLNLDLDHIQAKGLIDLEWELGKWGKLER